MAGFASKPMACSRFANLAGNSRFLCVVPAHVGAGYSLVVTWGGQSSPPSTATLSYEPPSLFSMSGPGVFRAPMCGDSYLHCNGVNLRPLGTVPERVT